MKRKRSHGETDLYEMEADYITLAQLHYREMPKEMYDKWVKQMQAAKTRNPGQSAHATNCLNYKPVIINQL